jgi:2'-5' RNA ligase
MSNKKRLYFGLWPTDEVRAAIAENAVRVVESSGDISGQPASGAIPACNYHLTAAFLGTVSASSLPDLIAMGTSMRFLAFRLYLERTGYWPRSQVAWVAPEAYPPSLIALVDDLWNKLVDLGFRRDERPYMPHITIGRNVGDGFAAQLNEPIYWPVESFALIESVTGPDGPVYTVLEEFSAGA